MKNSTCSRSSATREPLARVLRGLPAAGDLAADAVPDLARFGRRARQAEPAEQQLRDLLLLAQDRAPRRFGGMRGEHRLDPDLDHQAADFVEREPLRLEPRDGFDDAARLRRAFVQILAAAADAMHLLRHVDHLEPQRERAHQVARLRGRNVARAGRELAGALGAAVAPRDRGLPILLDGFEQGVAALLADHFADQRAEHVHVFAQLGVFQRKGNVGARHGRVSVARVRVNSRKNVPTCVTCVTLVTCVTCRGSSMSLIAQIAVFLGATVLAIPLFRRLRLSSILGYLAAGVVIGPWGLRIVQDTEGVMHIAEFGVVLLLFVIGLELQPSRLRAMRKAVFGLGLAQVRGHDRGVHVDRARARPAGERSARHCLRVVAVVDAARTAIAGRATAAQHASRPLQPSRSCCSRTSR